MCGSPLEQFERVRLQRHGTEDASAQNGITRVHRNWCQSCSLATPFTAASQCGKARGPERESEWIGSSQFASLSQRRFILTRFEGREPEGQARIVVARIQAQQLAGG